MHTNSNPSNTLIHSMMRAEIYDHPVESIKLIETHISWVILTGTYAYKIKKPYNLGFLDFSSLSQRRQFCLEELRLNKRLAASVYLDIVAISGSVTHPVLQGPGETIEYAVKMAQFPQEAQLDVMLADGKLGNKHIDAFAHLLAEFHQNTETASADTCFGNPEHVYQPVARTFEKIRLCTQVQQHSRHLAELENWAESFFSTHKHLFENRKHDGFIRECHGDLHLRNLLWLNGKPLAFDCLEFDPNLRWIDTLSDIAFLVMDLQDRQHPQLAYHFLNTYMECCGDYSGLQVFRFYLVYRAVIRAMVNAISAEETDTALEKRHKAVKDCHAYLTLAQSYTSPNNPVLIIVHGLSASGKSTLSEIVLEHIGAIRIRSDVERKRMFGLLDTTGTINSDSNTGLTHNRTEKFTHIYSQKASDETYTQLYKLADDALASGFSVIVDAAFLKYNKRRSFLKLAQNRNIPFVMLSLIASPDTLRQRIQARPKGVSDADIFVLEQQLRTAEPVHEDELPFQIIVDTEKNLNLYKLTSAIIEKSRQQQ
ncbi:AAA family ATPase [Nitrosomonas marina]|uniref:Aminoglycoside phosphotransferase domain-containing protein n=1 Tax=Nitrosomonas marina TaxID=917 RepID=A0A1H8CE19_9PROT|nr:bifunctional aminoglycoside phosphotransferase/ATP-binding protein [Nitrosomonas marina]SEM93149.1 hypothetical protein SAMN05216325_104157 [Nitrosomonas marina]